MPSPSNLVPCRPVPVAPPSRLWSAGRLCCLVGMTLGLVRGAAAATPDMTGAWRAVFDVGGVTDSCQMTILQTGGSLTMTGSCDGGGSLDLSGLVDSGGVFVVNGSGTLLCNDSTVSGAFSPDGCTVTNAVATCDSGSGTMSATRDGDGDGVCDLTDDCPLVANVDQTDTDHDGMGDACECAGVVCEDDGEPCTVNACDPTTGACTAVANVGASCNDGNACTTGDACTADGHCGGTAVTCPAVDGCHLDGTCDPATGACTSPVKGNGATCDDGNACTLADTCQRGVCVGGAGVACTAADACHEAGVCNPATGACSTPPAPDGTACDDGVFCTAGDHCTAGTCGGGARNCADDNACTVDACDESKAACTHDAATGQLCQDDIGVCNADATCVVACHTDADCADDGKDCTVEKCVNHGAGNVCVHTTDDSRCDDGVECTRDRCDADGTCVNAPDDTLCDDGAFCDGAETCDAHAGCRLGTAPDCSDANDCTDDGCDDTSAACVHSPHYAQKCNGGDGFCNAAGQCSECLADADCDDHLFCNGAETCTNERCRPGTPPNPSDGIACTVDACDEQTDGFTHVPDDSVCDDGKFCTGVEHCDALRGCQAGTPPPVDDGNECTTDHCDEAHDRVAHDPVSAGSPCHDGQDECSAGGTCLPCLADADCDDGVFCNGAEVCDPEMGCHAGQPPVVDDGVDCTHDHCDEATRTVVHAPDDSVCADGNPCTNTVCDAGTGCLTVHLPDGAACDVGIQVGVCAGGACVNLCQPMLAATPDVSAAALSLVEAVCPTCPIDLQALYGSHVEYDKCVRSACRALRHRGTISAKDRRRVQLLARRSDVAKKHWEIHVP